MSTVSIAALSPVSKRPKRVEAEQIARIGAWAITPALHASGQFDSRMYSVTHIPTGYRCGRATTLRAAKRLLKAMAAMPDQHYWRTLKYSSRMTAAKRAQGSAVIVSVLGPYGI